ncbi:hypothetical protein ACFXDH_50705 [Streptomyces sp. NPDC059467]|uniref:hypothetical protein n=1 Tax=Streptomyces sp. NPDC059467 TaxID=3346844 RepID=UPI0036A7BF3D
MQATFTIRRRTALLGALAAAAAAVSVVGMPNQAHALGAGRVCFFKAPTGAPIGPSGHQLMFGHAGWAYRVGSSGTWVYGSTENNSGKPTISAGQNTDSWSRTGSWAQVTADFKGALTINGHHYHNAGYYTQYRCRNTNTSAVGAANTTAAQQLGNGYDWFSNNCLTKGVQIFWAYDSSLRAVPPASNPKGIGSGVGVGPNWYIDHLNGFEATQNL